MQVHAVIILYVFFAFRYFINMQIVINKCVKSLFKWRRFDKFLHLKNGTIRISIRIEILKIISLVWNNLGYVFR